METLDTGRYWTHGDTGHRETLDTERHWTHEDTGHMETMDTGRHWTHGDTGHRETLDTWRHWTQKDTGHMETLDTERHRTYGDTGHMKTLDTGRHWTQGDTGHMETLDTGRHWTQGDTGHMKTVLKVQEVNFPLSSFCPEQFNAASEHSGTAGKRPVKQDVKDVKTSLASAPRHRRASAMHIPVQWESRQQNSSYLTPISSWNHQGAPAQGGQVCQFLPSRAEMGVTLRVGLALVPTPPRDVLKQLERCDSVA
ncbi:hypothetical protein P4O66_003746 [Electrophorus voltai]|uniref:Uncharacterized protein n=1 Tax=Electrophorus voltai TaxID=2609070 RepID=A0AAD8ZR00_9TELE|nr:hypothetical protein P4O66_003746 [Electrophorus voltai]